MVHDFVTLMPIAGQLFVTFLTQERST